MSNTDGPDPPPSARRAWTRVHDGGDSDIPETLALIVAAWSIARPGGSHSARWPAPNFTSPEIGVNGEPLRLPNWVVTGAAPVNSPPPCIAQYRTSATMRPKYRSGADWRGRPGTPSRRRTPAASSATQRSASDTSHRAGHCTTSITARVDSGAEPTAADTRIGVLRPILPYRSLRGFFGE